VWRIAHKWQGRIVGANGGSITQGDLQDHQRKLRRRVHQIVRSITENFEERLHLNTCISSLMELTNEIYAFDQSVEKYGGVSDSDVQVAREAFNALIPMLAPFAPHISEDLWESFGHSESLSRAQWPAFNAELAREEEIEVAIQINGKLRGRIFASASASDDELREAALADEKVKAATTGRDVLKVIVIPRKLVNVVVK
ncbi:MAG TPA: class I tRNA ligase family protein, partial [Blastocatellia bacterium]|nr:class I tRNA ligase family protein [Blastocatellia bacterium]